MSLIEILVSAALTAAAALATALVASSLPGLRLATRRALLVAGLAAAVLAPALAIAAPSLGLGLRPAEARPGASTPTPRPTAGPASPSPRIAPRVGSAPAPASAHARSSTEAATGPASLDAPTAGPLLPTVAALAWIAGAALGLLSLAFGLLRLRHLRRSLEVAADPRLAGLFLSDAIVAPATIGFLSPVVAVPRGFGPALTDDELAAVRRHEGSHAARKDPLAGLLARVARALHWPNPLVHVVSRRLDLLCERLADAEAVRGDPEAAPRYAACLVRIAERVLGERGTYALTGMLGPRHSLSRRIEALLDPHGPGDPRPTWGGRLGVVALALGSIALAACCCRAPAPHAPLACAAISAPAPLVIGFSPSRPGTDLATGLAFATFTDSTLSTHADPAFRGKLAVRFRPGTRLDRSSIFLRGNPALGLDLAAVQFLQYIPGTGNIPMTPAPGGVEVRDDAIVFTPAQMPIPDGQYSIGVFEKVRGVGGAPLLGGPVFHAFLVGSADTTAPAIVTTLPLNGARGVGAGTDVPPKPWFSTRAETEVRAPWNGPRSPDIIVRFSEPLAAASVTADTIRVVDAAPFVPGGGDFPAISAAPGYPRLRTPTDRTAPSGTGFEVVWRADPALGGLPFGSQVRVTVVGSDAGANAAPIRDLGGNALPSSYVFEFETLAPPDLPNPPGK